MLTSKQRSILRREANALVPVFQLGKDEIDDAVVQATNDCLAVRELIKLKVLETSPYSAKEAAILLAEKTGSESVQVIGGKFVLYKQKEQESQYVQMLNPGVAGAKRPPAKKKGTGAGTGLKRGRTTAKKSGNASRGDGATEAPARVRKPNARSFTAKGTIGKRAAAAKRAGTFQRAVAKTSRSRTQ